MLNRIVLSSGTGQMSADILRKYRSLELMDVVLMSDFGLLEVLGTLPCLANLTLEASDPASHPAHAPENSNSKSGGRKNFDALESVSIMGSFILIQHLIDSSCLNSIKVYEGINRVRDEHEQEPEDLLTPSIMIVASKWSQSLKNLAIISSSAHRYTLSKCLMLLTDLHEMHTFHLYGWRMGNMDDNVRRLVMSWPKLRALSLLPSNRTFISLSTLRVIAETCPELHYLHIPLDISTIPPIDTFSKSLLAGMSNPSGTIFAFNLPLSEIH